MPASASDGLVASAIARHLVLDLPVEQTIACLPIRPRLRGQVDSGWRRPALTTSRPPGCRPLPLLTVTSPPLATNTKLPSVSLPIDWFTEIPKRPSRPVRIRELHRCAWVRASKIRDFNSFTFNTPRSSGHCVGAPVFKDRTTESGHQHCYLHRPRGSKRLVGAILLEQNDEWQLQHRYMPLETMTGLGEEQIKSSLIRRSVVIRDQAKSPAPQTIRHDKALICV
jgi:hypothetical protein